MKTTKKRRPMMSLAPWLLTCALAAIAPGCGEAGTSDDDTLTTLTHGDVSGMQPGNATGQAFSGSYTIRGSHIDACRCRSNKCSNLMARTGFTREAAQQDGSLTL